MKKIAISSTGEGWEANVDQRFGRAMYFTVISVDGDDVKLDTISNQENMNASQGAGIQAAETVANTGAKVVLTGHVGPKAYRAIEAAGIEVYTNASGTVKEAYENYLAGKGSAAKSADVEGHWAEAVPQGEAPKATAPKESAPSTETQSGGLGRGQGGGSRDGLGRGQGGRGRGMGRGNKGGGRR